MIVEVALLAMFNTSLAGFGDTAKLFLKKESVAKARLIESASIQIALPLEPEGPPLVT